MIRKKFDAFCGAFSQKKIRQNVSTSTAKLFVSLLRVKWDLLGAFLMLKTKFAIFDQYKVHHLWSRFALDGVVTRTSGQCQCVSHILSLKFITHGPPKYPRNQARNRQKLQLRKVDKVSCLQSSLWVAQIEAGMVQDTQKWPQENEDSPHTTCSTCPSKSRENSWLVTLQSAQHVSF